MTEWTNVASVEEFKPGSFRLVDVDDITVIVFNMNGKFYAIQDVCTHDGGTLSDGEVEGCEIICPRHGARFDIRTGEVTAPPAYEDVQSFPVRVESGIVQVGN
jgi:3-phenylpropionate/trans-cinnamate dioxygenase ferredoxin component